MLNFFEFKNYLKRGEFAFSNSFKFLIKIIQIYSNFCHSEIFLKNVNYIKQHKNKHIWTETAYQCCETLYILKTFRPNYAKIIIFFDVLSSGSYSFNIITHHFQHFQIKLTHFNRKMN